MKNSALQNIFTNNVLLALILGAVLFGLIKYADYRFDLMSAQNKETETGHILSENKLQNEIKSLESAIASTQSNFTDILEQERRKNNSLENQFNDITNTVGALEKLSTTDPELLKKYSKVYFLNEHYVPISLTNIDSKYTNKLGKNLQIHSDVWQHLEDLLDAAAGDRLSLEVLSAYRSFGTQSALKSSYSFTYGAGTANQFSADQGYSEHQLGTALDFTTGPTNGALEGFEKTPEYKWLLANAYKYGFVISYPTGNTYYKFEPWHWRFVGVALSNKLQEDNMYFYDMDQRIIDTYLGNIFD